MDYCQVPVSLTKGQFNKIQSGKPIQLAAHQIAGPQKHYLMLHHENAKKVAGAIRRRKGVRIQISPYEFHASGEGIMDFFNKIKQGAEWIKKKVIDTPFYQSSIRPIARKAVDAGLALANPYLGAAAPLAQQGVNALGEKTGAYGIYRGTQPRFKIEDNMQYMLGAQHPAMWPTEPYLPDMGGKVRRRRIKKNDHGGSFRPA